MVTFGQKAIVLRCLEPIVEHSATASVCVVDNGSRDGTPEAIAECFPTVELHLRPDNPGFAVSTNVGIRAGLAPYVLVLNPDTWVPPETIEHLLTVLKKTPTVAVIGCRLHTADNSLDHACKRMIPTPTQALRYFLGRILPGIKVSTYLAPEIPDDAISPVDAINGAFMLIRRSAIDQVGMLDERYWMYGEDLDWCTRFRKAGWQVYYDGRVSALHLKGASSNGRRSWKLNFEFHRSMWLYFNDHIRPTSSAPTALMVKAGIGFRCLLLQTINVVKAR